MLRQFEQHLVDQDWTEAQAGVQVKLVPSPDGQETFILARSADRRAKELAMHEKFVTRLEAGLKKIQAAAEAGRLKDEATAGQRLGQLKQQNSRASQAFEVTASAGLVVLATKVHRHTSRQSSQQHSHRRPSVELRGVA